jgi:lysophospholipase L1-like esterase
MRDTQVPRAMRARAPACVVSWELLLLLAAQACADQSQQMPGELAATAGMGMLAEQPAQAQAGQSMAGARAVANDSAIASAGVPAAVGGNGAAGLSERAGQSAALAGASAAAAGSVAGSVAGMGGAAGAVVLAAGSGAADTAGAGGKLAKTTVYIAGDSTVMTYTSGDLEGWGQELGSFFDAQVTIVNKAIGGRSVAFFMYTVATDAAGNYLCSDDQGTPKFSLDASGKRIDTSQWSQIKSGIKAGDFLLIQFGHNDETHDCPRYVSTADYETELGNMADAARAKGGTPIFVTPMGHRAFKGNQVDNTLLPYADAMKAEASKKMLEVVDLNLRSVEYYMMVGDAFLAANIFDGGTTHFHKQGAIEMATLIVGELRKNAGPLAAYLK